MESALIFAAFLLIVGALVGPLLALIALSRIGVVEAMQARVDRLEARLRKLEPGPAVATPKRVVVAPEPAVVSERLSPPERASTPEPPPAPEPPPVPDPVPEPLPRPEPESERPRSPEPRSPSLEHLLGARGAAILGGIALALAGLFFAQYAIAHGWFDPTARVVSGGLLGAALVLFRARLARATTPLVADVLAGAGAVMGFASAWSAYSLHGLLSIEVAFLWMASVTAGTCLLSARQHRQVVAWFGLIGGFATPLLLETWTRDPLGLFGYLLLLDVGLLALARRERWLTLAPVALGGTAFLQGLWLFADMGQGESLLGLSLVGAFSFLFLLATETLPSDDSAAARRRAFTRHATLAVAGLQALSFAARAELDVGIVPLGAFVLLFSAAACELARRHREPLIATAAAMVGMAVLSVWLGTTGASDATLAQFAGAAIAVAALFLADARRGGRPTGEDWLSVPGAPLVIATFVGVTVLGALTLEVSPEVGVRPLAAGGVSLLVLLWLGLQRGLRGAPALLCLALGAGLALIAVQTGTSLDAWLAHGVALGVCATILAGRLLIEAGSSARSWASVAACAVVVPVLALAPGLGVEGFTLAQGGVLALALLATVAALSSGEDWAYGTVVVAAMAGSLRWLVAGSGSADLLWAIAPLFAVTLPVLASGRRSPCGLAAFAPWLWMPLVYGLAETTVGVPVAWLALGAPVAALAVVTGSTACVASACAITCLAGARWIDVEWLSVGATLVGLVLLITGAGRRVPSLRQFGVALMGLGTLALLGAAFVPARFASGPLPGAGELLVAFVLPAAVLACGACFAARTSGAQRQEASGLGIGAALLLFAWIDLAVADAFHDGTRIVFELTRHPARDLALSIAWAAYALALLGVGTWTRRQSLRWLSLGFVLLAVGKVFLHDLGELEGLYRVGSMAGLALSLLAVSLLYQRVVFRRAPAITGT